MIVSTQALTKLYGPYRALDSVDLQVPRGGVYGLVGLNGAGKTTLIGILAGLRRPSSGSIHMEVGRAQVAVLPDTPQFEPWLTAHEVVDLARSLASPEVRDSRVNEALHETGLLDAADRRVGGFSRGMLQRLGLAATIVGEPELLLLDEPCSALDPAGRREVLDLVKSIGNRATVLFSSHILSDVQEVSDTVGVLQRGSLVYQGTLEALLVGHAVPAYRVRLRGDPQPLVAILGNESWVTAVEVEGSDLRVRVSNMTDAEKGLARALAQSRALVVSLTPEAANLEDVFLELTR